MYMQKEESKEAPNGHILPSTQGEEHANQALEEQHVPGEGILFNKEGEEQAIHARSVHLRGTVS
jgi:hypothetical protein